MPITIKLHHPAAPPARATLAPDTPAAYIPSPHQTLFSVEQFATAQPAFTISALRNLIFKAESRRSSRGLIAGNGLIECGAIIRVGRKVLIDGEKFLAWIRQHNNGQV